MNEKRLPWTNGQGTLFRTYGEFNYKRGFIFAYSTIIKIKMLIFAYQF